MPAGVIHTASIIDLSAGFATPDLLARTTFGSSYSPFTDGGGGAPSGGNISRQTGTKAPVTGTTGSVQRTWAAPSTDFAAQMFYDMTSKNRVWLGMWYRATAGMDNGIQKFIRWYADRGTTNTVLGGIYLTDRFELAFDVESASRADIGVAAATVTDGNWHSLEIDCWRVGQTLPSIQTWHDGSLITHADGAAANGYSWLANRLQGPSRTNSEQIASLELIGVINGGTTSSGTENIDWIGLSSIGRIGPT